VRSAAVAVADSAVTQAMTRAVRGGWRTANSFQWVVRILRAADEALTSMRGAKPRIGGGLLELAGKSFEAAAGNRRHGDAYAALQGCGEKGDAINIDRSKCRGSGAVSRLFFGSEPVF
jgi:hypothetical protein